MGSKQITAVVFICCLTYAFAFYKECTETGKITSLKVNGVVVTATSPIVNLYKGKNASLEIGFTTSKPSKTVTSKCYGVVEGIKVPFPVETNGCLSMSSSDCSGESCCPLKGNTAYTFKTNIFVKTIYPAIKLVIIWEDDEDDGQAMFCLDLKAQIV